MSRLLCAAYRSRGNSQLLLQAGPHFYGEGARYFGVELEIDGAGERSDRAWQLVNAANSNGLEHIYIKHDGSLEDGMEIVTHPMTLGYHLAEMPWGTVVAQAVRMGYTSHKDCTCGLHVHVNRSAFGSSEEAQEAVIARILFLWRTIGTSCCGSAAAPETRWSSGRPGMAGR